MKPPPRGAVLRYAYLWAREHSRRQEEGTKDPQVVVIAVARTESEDASRVYVVAVTHTPPISAGDAVPFPAAIKRRLGLDDRPAWIVTMEANAFVWPGPDVRPVGNAKGAVYGKIPAQLLDQVVNSYLANSGRSRIVTRTA